MKYVLQFVPFVEKLAVESASQELANVFLDLNGGVAYGLVLEVEFVHAVFRLEHCGLVSLELQISLLLLDLLVIEVDDREEVSLVSVLNARHDIKLLLALTLIFNEQLMTTNELALSDKIENFINKHALSFERQRTTSDSSIDQAIQAINSKLLQVI